jgi:hypothetical protein
MANLNSQRSLKSVVSYRLTLRLRRGGELGPDSNRSTTDHRSQPPPSPAAAWFGPSPLAPLHCTELPESDGSDTHLLDEVVPDLVIVVAIQLELVPIGILKVEGVAKVVIDHRARPQRISARVTNV